MENDVVNHVLGSLDQAPVEIDRPASRTRTPPSALIANGDTEDLTVGLRSQLANTRDEFSDGYGAKVTSNVRRAELDDGNFLAAEPDVSLRLRFFGELTLDPGLRALDKSESFALRPTARDGGNEASLLEAQDVAAGFGITPINDRNRDSAKL